MNQKEFDIEFGKRIPNISENIFLRFLAASFIIVFGTVLYLANLDFESLKHIVKTDIEDRYISYLINSDITPAKVKREEDFFTPAPENIAPRTTEEILKAADLPFASPPIELDLGTIGELTTSADVKSDQKAIRDRFYRTEDNIVRELPGWLDEELENFKYTIKRKAEITIKKPETLAKEKEEFGYRDQNEIMSVIYSKSDAIESCYQRQARRTWVKEGFVLVEFQISPKGFVLTNTIKIIESTVLNRSVDQCIIKTIRRWRNFAKLESRFGIAKVTHKFIFR